MTSSRSPARALGAAVIGVCLALSPGCARREAPAPAPPYTPPPGLGLTAPGGPALGAPYQTGLATWYGQSFAGKKTSNGERFDPQAMTAANRKLPFGTWVEVRRVDTGSVVRVRINDRGPWGDSRKVIDLSYRAAQLLGFVEMGAVKVEVRVVNGP